MRSFGRRIGALALVVPLVLGLAACSGGGDEPATDSGAPSGSITVFSAASLTEPFKEIAAAFEAANPGTKIDFNFAGTPTLRTQLEQGARADVFASANREQMELARAGGVVEGTSSTFARNSLMIITPVDNPAGIESAADLGRQSLKLVVAQEDVPVGAYTRQALVAMSADASFGAGFSDSVLGNVVSLESNVKQVVAKVELGEADAGIVYGTDITPAVAAKLHKVEIPEAFNVVAEYPAALVTDRRNDAGARAFIDFLLSAPGQEIMARYGFLSAG
jgi:molybdate transport system substrate-binding protein